ncbi:hypothetical protein SEA_CULVER_183 [Gordonia phage Culver]|nr:hypothetical protein SEA_CULVER_183 [Gordonia phage Culver]
MHPWLYALQIVIVTTLFVTLGTLATAVVVAFFKEI